MSVIWSPLATEKIRDIATYIALDKPAAAEQWIGKIFDSVKQLEDFPDSGRIVPEIKRNDIRELVQGSYRVIYKIHNKDILILVVKSYRQILDSDEIQS